MEKIRKKTCTQCKEIKSLSEFYHRKEGKEGYASRCKTCKRKYDKKHHQRNKERDRPFRGPDLIMGQKIET